MFQPLSLPPDVDFQASEQIFLAYWSAKIVWCVWSFPNLPPSPKLVSWHRNKPLTSWCGKNDSTIGRTPHHGTKRTSRGKRYGMRAFVLQTNTTKSEILTFSNRFPHDHLNIHCNAFRFNQWPRSSPMGYSRSIAKIHLVTILVEHVHKEENTLEQCIVKSARYQCDALRKWGHCICVRVHGRFLIRLRSLWTIRCLTCTLITYVQMRLSCFSCIVSSHYHVTHCTETNWSCMENLRCIHCFSKSFTLIPQVGLELINSFPNRSPFLIGHNNATLHLYFC